MANENPDQEKAPEQEQPKQEAQAAETQQPKAEAPKKEQAPAEKKEAAQKNEASAGDAPAEEAPKKELTAQDLLKEEIGQIKVRKAKGSKNITSGIAKVLATFNNTKVCITDRRGNVISWSSSGKMNFRGSRKSTAYAGQVVAQDAARAAMAHGLKELEVHVQGPGLGRDSAIRAFQAIGLEVTAIVDATPIPHNGCRPPKRRRV